MDKNINGGFEAQFSLIICGDDLDIENISEKIGIQQTKVIRKGQMLSRLPQIIAQQDAWYHSIQLSMPEDRDPALLGLLDTINNAKAFIDEQIANGSKVILRLSVNSDTAYMAYRLMPATLEALLKIGLPLDINSVSWGDFSF